MADIFADTSGWGSLFDTTQSCHRAAVELYQAARRDRRRFVTTNYIVTELAALLTSPLNLPRGDIIAVIEGMKCSPFVEIIHVDAPMDKRAWDLFQRRRDKRWSLVDCASFMVMAERNLSEALASDHHFEQADFVRLLAVE